MNFLGKLFGSNGAAKKTKSSLKLTPEVLAVKERIAARKEKEEKAHEAQLRRERLTNGGQTNTKSNNHHSAAIREEIRRLEKRAVVSHNDRLEANSEMMANSKLDLWYNTIVPEAPPETIAPDMVIPESFSDEEENEIRAS
jgi:hypothetical protein